MGLLMVVVGLVVGHRLFRQSSSRLYATFMAGAAAYEAVEALRAGSLLGRANWLALSVIYSADVRRIVRAWRLIPARDSVTL